MVHFDNLDYILRNGMCIQSHKLADPNYIGIGDSILIKQRETYPLNIDPFGNLGDYVPFYFEGHSPMLYNIKTGYRGITKRSQDDLVFIVSSIGKIIDKNLKWCFTDGHAKQHITCFYNTLQDLTKVDWEAVKLLYWHNTYYDMDLQRRKQAEFLVKDFVPVDCICKIVVLTNEKKDLVDKMLNSIGLNIEVSVDIDHKLYYL